MKIIDNPALGIGLLVCVGIAVFGIAMMTTAEGQPQFGVMVTSDDGVFGGSSITSSDDFDDSPFIIRDAAPSRPREVAQAGSARVEQARMQDAAAQQRQRQQNAVRVEAPPVTRAERGWQSDDPFAASPQERLREQPQDQPREQQRGQQVVIERRIESNPLVVPPRQQVVQAAQRDELLFRIVKLRLQRGEFEQLAPVVMQMQNPEKAIETMLDFAEKSADDENIEQLLDVATAVTVQMGHPRPPMPGMMGMPGGMGGPGMPGMMPMGMPPGQPMPGWSSGGMPAGMPGQPMPMGGGMMGGVPAPLELAK